MSNGARKALKRVRQQCIWCCRSTLQNTLTDMIAKCEACGSLSDIARDPEHQSETTE